MIILALTDGLNGVSTAHGKAENLVYNIRVALLKSVAVNSLLVIRDHQQNLKHAVIGVDPDYGDRPRGVKDINGAAILLIFRDDSQPKPQRI
jgi:hypothetical protein